LIDCRLNEQDSQILLDACDALVRTYDTYGYKFADLERIVAIGIYFQNIRKAELDKKEGDDRAPNKDEKFVFGRGNVKK
jgi:hypothetical protein